MDKICTIALFNDTVRTIYRNLRGKLMPHIGETLQNATKKTIKETVRNTAIGAVGFFTATQLGVGAITGMTVAGVAGASALGYAALLPARWLIDFCVMSKQPAISGQFSINDEFYYRNEYNFAITQGNETYFNRAYSYSSVINLAHNMGAAAFGAAALGLPIAPVLICAVLGYVVHQTVQPMFSLMPSLTTMLILSGIGLGIAAYANPVVAATLTTGIHALPGAPAMAINALQGGLHAVPALLQSTLNVYANILHATLSGAYAVPGLLHSALQAAINAIQTILTFGSPAPSSPMMGMLGMP